MKTELYEIEDIDTVAEKLKEGKIIAFPTDTVFGLACVYDNEEAKNNIIKAKGRDEKKALPMMCSDYQMINKVAYINEKEEKLINKFMPGAITIIFKKKNLPDYVTSGLDTVGIRVPDYKWIIDLITKVGKPLLVTSANLSDTGSLFKWEDVYRDLNEKIDGIVKKDAASLQASTIVMAFDEVKILREGPISKEEIEECIND